MIVIQKLLTRHIAELLCGLVCVLGSVGFAQDPLPVQVTFEFNNVSVPIAEPARKTLEAEIGGLLAQALQSQFGFWTFQGTGSANTPRLKVQLQKSAGLNMSLEFVNAAGTVVKKWEAEMFKSVDLELRPLPRPSQWPAQIGQTFSTKLLVPNQQEILETLKPSVAIGRELAIVAPVQNSGALPSAILPLNWETHQQISECQFLLRFNRQGGGKVTILSTGLGNSAQYTPDHPQFPGIIVQLEKWQEGSIEEPISAHVGDLPNLAPVEFYLKNEKLPGAAPE